MFQIEKGVDLPPRTQRSKYPFAEMVPGDSFFVPRDQRERSTIAAAVARAGQDALGKGNYTVRKINDENGNFTGVRIWRTA